MNGNNEQILLIAPVFFDYYKEIIAESERLGYSVTFFPDTHSNNNLIKAIGRVKKEFINLMTHRFFVSKILPLIKSKRFSKVLIIASMNFSYLPEDIKIIHDINKNTEIIAYQWDSERNMPYFVKSHPYIDRIFTFDLQDCKNSEKYHFLPLFYIPIYERVGHNAQEEMVYDCSYIGTAHPKKLAEISNISRQLEKRFPKQFIYHYMPSRLKFIYHKIKNIEYKNVKFKDFKHIKLSQEEIADIMKKSFCILDAPQEGQTGLTMRTIECLGAKKKLITTNADIKKYDFYDERNVLVFDGKFDFNSPFFSEPYHEIPQDIYNSYSLESWLKKLLSD